MSPWIRIPLFYLLTWGAWLSGAWVGSYGSMTPFTAALWMTDPLKGTLYLTIIAIAAPALDVGIQVLEEGWINPRSWGAGALIIVWISGFLVPILVGADGEQLARADLPRILGAWGSVPAAALLCAINAWHIKQLQLTVSRQTPRGYNWPPF